jgi:hypothetical protein
MLGRARSSSRSFPQSENSPELADCNLSQLTADAPDNTPSEHHHRQRPWRQQLPAPVLCADAARFTEATAARGDAATRASAARIANAFRTIKRDETGPALQKEFFDKAARLIATKQ